MKTAFLYFLALLGYIASAHAQVSIVDVTTTPVSCNGSSDGTVTITITGGQAPYIFTLQKGSEFHFSPSVSDTFYTFTNVHAANWIVLVQDDNDDADFTYGPVTEPTPVAITSQTSVPITCNGYNDGQINISASGESGSYIFTLNPGAVVNATGHFTGLSPDSYTVNVADASGCPSSAVSNLIPLSDPAVISILTENATDISCNGSDDGKVNVKAAGGTGAYTYTLNPGAVQSNGSGNFNALGPGIYSVSVTDINACPAASGSPLTVNEPSEVKITSEVKSDISCYGSGDGSITITATGGIPPYQFTLSPGSVSNSTGIFAGLDAGTYHVSVSDANGCGPAVSNDFVIIEPGELIITSVVKTNITCHDLNDGMITVTSTGGNLPVTYTLNPGAVSNQTGIFNNLSAGIYTVEVRGSGTCPPVNTSPVNISNPYAISINSEVKTDITCNGAADGSITIVASGGTGTLQYKLMPGNINNTGGNFPDLGPGTYTVSVNDDEGCAPVVSSPLTVSEPGAITVNTQATTDVTCPGVGNGRITVTGAGGTPPYLYTLNPGSVNSASGIYNNLPPGTYTVNISDSRSCPPATTSPLTVNQPLPLKILTIDSTDITCNGNNDGEIHVTGTGGTAPLSFTLMPGNSTNGTGDFLNLAAGMYTVSMSDTHACAPVTTAPVGISEPPAISITSVNSTGITCNGDNNGSITVVASGGTGTLHYTLTPGVITNTTGIFNGLTGGSYTVTVTDDNACSPASTGPVDIIEPAVINATVDGTSKLYVDCFGDSNGSVDITVSGGTSPYQVTWTGPDGFSSTSGNISGLKWGTYGLFIRDANNCSFTDSAFVQIDEPEPLDISLSATNVTCNGMANGSITVTATGGTLPYQYSKNGITYQASNIFNGLIKNLYTVSVRDSRMCSLSDTISVNEPDELQVASEIRIDNNKCFSDSLGEIRILSVVGGKAPYVYSIDSGKNYNSNAIFLNLGAGTYQTVVKDASGCTAQGNANLINQPSKIRITNYAQVDVTGCSESSNGQIAVEATGGTGIKNYRLDGGSPRLTGSFNSVGGGDHVISITDANSCMRDTIVTLAAPPPIVLTSVVLTAVTGCSGDNNGSAEVTAAGGTGILQYAIDGGAFVATGTFNGLTGGDHTVTVKDAAGCLKDTLFNIDAPAAIIIASLDSTDVTCSGYDDGAITISASGGTAPYTYTLLPGSVSNGTGIFDSLTPGTYTVEIDDAQGCGPVVTVPVDISEPAPVSIDSVFTAASLCAGDNNAEINIFASGGTAPYLYSIDDEANYVAGGDFTGLSSGTYHLSLQDGNSCKIYIDTVTFTEPAALVVSGQSKTDVTTCSGDSSGSVSYTLTGGTGLIEYSINGTDWAPSGDFANLPGGSYTVLTRDENGCSNNSPVITIDSPSPVTATIAATPALDEFNKGTISITDASGGTGIYTYSISGTGGPFVATSLFTDLDDGDYDVVVADENGCTFEQTVTVGAVPPLSVSVNTENVSCFNAGDASITMTANDATGQPEYSIDDSSSWQTDGSFTGLLPATYHIFVRDEDGRYFSDTLTITEPPALGIFSNVTPVSCSSGSTDGAVAITVTGASGVVTYEWSNGAMSKDLSNIGQGIYTLDVMDENGCSAADTIEVPAITTVVADAGADTSVCPGTVFTFDGKGGTEVSWFPADGLSNPALPNPSVTVNTTISYVLTVTGMNECTDTDTITLSVFPDAGLFAGSDTLITGDQAMLNAEGGPFVSYSWTPAESLDDPASASPVATPPATTEYIVVAVTEDGCHESDTVIVRKPGSVVVYNAFSPNGDGVNDYWDIDHASDYPNIIVQVYNRWGEVLFTSKGYSDDKRWDGTYKGKPAPIGTYYYVVVPFTGASAITGPLTIIR